jgi:hypothetical protein
MNIDGSSQILSRIVAYPERIDKGNKRIPTIIIVYSKYDDIIKKYAGNIGWDRRLLTYLIYQESRLGSGLYHGPG